MRTCQDIYMEPEVFHHNNCIVRVYRPILSVEERERRIEQIKKAAVSLIIEAEKNKARTNQSFNDTPKI